MADSDLVVANSIQVLTQNGVCQVDLCLGDITKLKKEEEVDVIVISAFRGDYSPSPRSVIGALWRTFGLRVESLAKDKEEDLRKLYSCWWSKPLPRALPYRRLLCFETRRMMDGRPQELVANVFRCLVPILNNKEGTIITPLLNAQQGADEVAMLRGMVEAAVSWMKAGLPLRRLKLVLYAQVENGQVVSSSLKSFDDVTQAFSSLKERYEMQLLLPKAVPLEYDVYLSFSEGDEAVAKVIREKLSAAKDSIHIYDSSNQTVDKDQVFQQDMYTVMMKSARVLTVLSPHYLKDSGCIDQYNIALCCNRRAHRDMLAPFYVDSVELMPTYMGLVQYVDCRPHDPSKIDEACSQLTVSLSATLHTELRIAEFDPLRYDVFLSYSHCDTEKANRFVETLARLNPSLKVFFDVQELKAGKSWQRTLYHSIDGSRCMLALISVPYLKSAVCQEEFSLAMAKHYAKGKQHLQLIPICLEELTSIQPEFTHIPMVKGTPDVFEDTVEAVCLTVVQWLRGAEIGVSENITALFDEHKVPPVSCYDQMVALHQAQFQEEFGTEGHLLDSSKPFPPSLSKVMTISKQEATSQDALEWDVTLSFHSDDQKYADFLASVLQNNAPGLRVDVVASNHREKLDSLETCACVVPILSPNYLESVECVEEFHIALWRQRVSNPAAPHLLPVAVHSLPPKPTYFHLVHSPVNTTHALWAELIARWHVGLPADIEATRQAATTGAQVSPSKALALTMATYRVLQRCAAARASDVKSEHPPRPALFNLMKLRDQVSQISQPENTPPPDDCALTLLTLSSDVIPDEWRHIRPTEEEEEEGEEEEEEKGEEEFKFHKESRQLMSSRTKLCNIL